MIAYPTFCLRHSEGKGKGTRINLNCFSSNMGFTSVIPSGKLATNTVKDLQLPFRSLADSDLDPGASINGPCFDIYAQENLSVLKKP